MYTDIQTLTTHLSIDVANLNSTDVALRTKAQENVEEMIRFSSAELKNRLGFEPLQSEEKTQDYTLKTISDTIYLREPVRTRLNSDNEEIGIELKIGGATVDTTAFELVDPFKIRLVQEEPSGVDIEITGRFGLYSSLSEMKYTDIQAATHAIAYGYLFKSGVVRSVTQGTSTTSYATDSWVSEENVNRIVNRYIKYTNLEK